LVKTAQIGILFLLVIAVETAPAAPGAIDVEHSTIRIHVGKSGLFSAAGHEHWVRAPIAEGTLEEGPSSSFSFRVDSRQMKVEEDKNLSADQQAQVEHTMHTQVLESDKYPDIRFRSTAIEPGSQNSWIVHGELSLHGQTRTISATVYKQESAYVGRCQIKQSDFGIEPVRVAGGMVRVKDELDIQFSVLPAH